MIVSFIVPAFNEEGNIEPFFDAVVAALALQLDDVSCEVVFIDDGSSDATFAVMLRILREKSCERARVKAVSFSRNFGKEAALYAGLHHAIGDIVAFVDADMQQPPAVAFEMVQVLRDQPEYDCVAAYQKARRQGWLLAKCSSAFYRVLGSSSNMDVVADASDFRVFRAPVARALMQLPEYHRFSKGLFSWVGFRTLPFPYTPAERLSGKTTWSFPKLVRYALNGVISFTTKPLRIATWLGLLSSLAAVIYFVVVIIQNLAFGIDVPGYTTIVCLILLLGGIQLLVLGIIGEYLARVYVQGKNRPVYIERRYEE